MCLVCCPRSVLFEERQTSPLDLHLVFEVEYLVYFLRLHLVFEVFEILRLLALNDVEGQACLVYFPRLVLFVER